MKIVHIVPGSGGTFYCQNCIRDNNLVKSLKNSGHDVTMVPMYLPLYVDDNDVMGDTPVFYGAINIYLKQVFSLYRKAPVWLERFFDSNFFLRLAAKMSGSTDAAGMFDMTESMLKGEHGQQSTELDHLTTFLQEHIQPDIIHISNALLLGLAPKLKERLHAKIVCSLEDENEWIDPMKPDEQKKIWDLIADQAKTVDAFIAVSETFGKTMQEKLKIPAEKISIVYPGMDFSTYEQTKLPERPTIGYLARITESFGLDVLLDAFILLKKTFADAQLLVTGGYTAADKPYLKKIHKRIKQAKVGNDVIFLDEFDKPHRLEFLKRLSILSVPAHNGQAFGSFLSEALASGVPVVQPDTGGFSEVITMTQGGKIYAPNTPEKLAETLTSLLEHPPTLQKLGENGFKHAHQLFDIQKMTADMLAVYEQIQ